MHAHSAVHPLLHGFGLGGWIPRALDERAQVYIAQEGSAEDGYWMAQAILAAMERSGPSHPNPCVGAVLVKNGRLLCRAATLAYGDLHAERHLLQQVDPAVARGATCYTTLEPCTHHGKQPPCSEALIAAGIARCVIGTQDPFHAVAGRGIAALRAAGIAVEVGVLQRESRAWHFPFLAHLALKAKRPVLIAKWAQTLDGHLADDKGVSQWISGPRSRAYAHWLRQKYDVVMVGIGTVLADAPSLTVRDAAGPRLRHPFKCIYDPYGRLPLAEELVWRNLRSELHEKGPCLFWMVHQASAKLPPAAAAWKDLLVPVLLDERSGWAEKLGALTEAYVKRTGRSLQSIMVEGGAQLLTHLQRADLLDAWQVFLRSGILGGTQHRIGRLPVREGEDAQAINPPRALMDRFDFRLVSSYQLDDDIVLESVHRRFDLWS